jgi:hypothetical protein
MAYIVPLSSAPNQSFNITMTIDGAPLTLQLAFRFSEMAGYWVMTVFDRLANLLLDSIPLLTGANVLGQYAYLNIGSAFVINASGITTMDYPIASNLGVDFLLLWDDTPEF